MTVRRSSPPPRRPSTSRPAAPRTSTRPPPKSPARPSATKPGTTKPPARTTAPTQPRGPKKPSIEERLNQRMAETGARASARTSERLNARLTSAFERRADERLQQRMATAPQRAAERRALRESRDASRREAVNGVNSGVSTAVDALAGLSEFSGRYVARGTDLLQRGQQLAANFPTFSRTADAMIARGTELANGPLRINTTGGQRVLTGLGIAADFVDGYTSSTATTTGGRAANGALNAGAQFGVSRALGPWALLDDAVNGLSTLSNSTLGQDAFISRRLTDAVSLTPSRNVSGITNNVTTLADSIATGNTAGLDAAHRRNLSGENGFFGFLGGVYGSVLTGRTEDLQSNFAYDRVADNRTFIDASDRVFGAYDATVNATSDLLSRWFGP